MDYYEIHNHPLNGKIILSNSRINSELDKINGKLSDKNKQENYRFGSLFHECLLEPERRTIFSLPQNDYNLIVAMMKSCYDQLGVMFFQSKKAKREHAYFWKMLGHWWKCKVDLQIGGVVNDIKTTSATSQEEFERAALKFNYDQQCFIYMNGAKVKQMNLIGVSKAAPHDLFYLECSKGDHFYQSGEHKLLTAMQKLNLI
jgi:hypothetical protein